MIGQSFHEERGPRVLDTHDFVIIGGGILGLATAYSLVRRNPGKTIIVLEKESTVATHQSGRNSGVIHSGIYYKPGSAKAGNCRRGLTLIEEFADEHGIPRARCGKVIVATDEAEEARLLKLYERGCANGVRCRLITPAELKEREPHCRGIRAIHVEDTGIIDYALVCQALSRAIEAGGGRVLFRSRVTGIRYDHHQVRVQTVDAEYSGRFLVNCAGLHSDRVTAMCGQRPPVKIVPFRGEYYELRSSARHLCRNLIYPVPDPAFPFLGVHFTRMIAKDPDGHRVECGPNAVLAFAREGYSKTRVSLSDSWETLTYPAFWRVAWRHWRTGGAEWLRSWSKRAFVRALRRLVPEISKADLSAAPAGVRAQALAPDGTLLDDFSIVEAERAIHVCNAPSPAATASLAIGSHIADLVAKQRDH
jgi:L-2-hydroxyglutarate oxidase